MDFSVEKKVVLSVDEVKKIIAQYVEDETGEYGKTIDVRFDVSQGDVGPKEPLDYSDYADPHLKKVVVYIT